MVAGFRGFARIPSTIPPAPPDWISGCLDYGKQFVAASPIRTSVWCSPGGGFFFQKRQVPGVLQPNTVFFAFYLNPPWYSQPQITRDRLSETFCFLNCLGLCSCGGGALKCFWKSMLDHFASLKKGIWFYSESFCFFTLFFWSCL